MDISKNILVAVGGISLSTEDGDTHTLIAGGESCELSTPELHNLHDAIHSYLIAQ